MKNVIFLFLLIFTLPSFGQVFGPPKDVPKSYWKELGRKEKQEVRQEIGDQKDFEKESGDEFDFIIPAVPLPATASIQAEGNWSRAFLEIPENEEDIKARLKGKFCMAILDTGEPDHSEVVKYKYPGKESRSFTGEPVIDGHFHATHVAGSQVAKVQDSYIGIAHIAAQAGHFKQVYYKVCTNRGGCNFAWMSDAIRDFIRFYKEELEPNGWKGGINMSIGGYASSADLSAAMREAKEAGIAIFASAGNNGQNRISNPAADVSANAVGAHDQQGNKARFSNWGPELFVNAPGVSVLSTCLGDTECVASGTSMSSPQAAAAFALLQMMNPAWTVQQTLDFMARHGTDAGEPGFDEEFGYGIPKIGKYLEAMGDEPDDPDDPCKECPKKDCPDCPDCPDIPEQKYRYYTTTLPGPYRIFWTTSTQSQAQLSTTQEMDLNQAEWMTVSNINVRFASKEDAEAAYAAINKQTTDFFGNRGMQIHRGSDIREAMAWTDFFYRMIIQQYLQGPVKVLSFTGTNPSGQSFEY